MSVREEQVCTHTTTPWPAQRERLRTLEALFDAGRSPAQARHRADGGTAWGGRRRSIARWLAVAWPDGIVVATDQDTTVLGRVSHPNLGAGPTCSGRPAEREFDVIHVRLLLAWLADRRTALRRSSGRSSRGLARRQELDFSRRARPAYGRGPLHALRASSRLITPSSPTSRLRARLRPSGRRRSRGRRSRTAAASAARRCGAAERPAARSGASRSCSCARGSSPRTHGGCRGRRAIELCADPPERPLAGHGDRLGPTAVVTWGQPGPMGDDRMVAAPVSTRDPLGVASGVGRLGIGPDDHRVGHGDDLVDGQVGELGVLRIASGLEAS